MRGSYHDDNEPFFVLSDGSPLQPQLLRKTLRHILGTRLNLNASLYDFHSLRIGRTTDMFKMGYTIEQIKLDSKQIHSATKRPASVHILADAQMEFWPQNDNICIMDFRPGWSLKWWTASLRAESIRIQCHSVILYFEMAQNMEVQPLKNTLQALCQVIRQHSRGARIYVANLLPRVHASPVARPLSETNFVILQVARGVNRALSKIYFLSTFEHFVSKRGNRIIKPTHKYFGETGELTGFGCLILRECFLREAGLKPYWFK